MQWSGQQEKALRDVSEWLNDPSRQVYYLAGFAGTGKTTLAQELAYDANGLVLFAAFTGKAASVLRSKGCGDASTLHSLLYNVADRSRAKLVEMEGKLKELMEVPEPEDMNESIMLAEEVTELQYAIRDERSKLKGPLFALNPDSIVGQSSLVVLDECSMVNEDLARDLLSFKRKVLVLGDPAQLPPVKGAGYFTNRKPDLLLTEIHRQARDNPIIRWSMLVREGKPIPFEDAGRARKIHKDDIDAEWLANEGGQLLVGKNETRRKLNQRIRRVLGHTGVYPEEGERLVVLRNDRQLDVLNGVVCTAASNAEPDDDGDVFVDLDYEGRPIPLVWVDTREFRAYADPKATEEYDPGYRDKLQLDYGYALTVHKSQGSQWDVVTICDDGFGKNFGGSDLRKQWLYTGITRAAEHLNIVV